MFPGDLLHVSEAVESKVHAQGHGLVGVDILHEHSELELFEDFVLIPVFVQIPIDLVSSRNCRKLFPLVVILVIFALIFEL